MSQKYFYIIIILFFFKNSVAQVFTNYFETNNLLNTEFFLFDTISDNQYFNHIQADYHSNIIAGYAITVFNERIPGLIINYTFDNSPTKQAVSDSLGRICLIPGPLKAGSKAVHISISNANYFNIDTTLSIVYNRKSPLVIKLHPRYRILLKGRVYAGTLPLEDANVEIIHAADTFKTKTLSCYTDEEKYWNCLYLGMFKQNILFDNPMDSVFIKVDKTGHKEKRLAMRCCDYNGAILPIKLKYDNILPKLAPSSLSLKITPPIFHNWMISLNYVYNLPIKNYNRLGLGIDASMNITEVATKITTFRDMNATGDSAFITVTSDSAYISTLLGPTIIWSVNNPLRRNFGIYTGIYAPYCFQQKTFYISPFIGTRFYLDLNKAFVVELRYLDYNLNVEHYLFNPYGNADSYNEKENFKKLMFNLGLLIRF